VTAEILAEPVYVPAYEVVACDTEVFRHWEMGLHVVMLLCWMLRPGSGVEWTHNVLDGRLRFCWLDLSCDIRRGGR